jgi:glycerol-3-phosphate acyltransferase PlsX
MTIAVDAMGGDFGPDIVVPGAIDALKQAGDFELALYGREDAIGGVLEALQVSELAISIVPCRDDIEMSEAPAAAIRGKPDSPIVKGMRDQKAGRTAAFVSAGSTGAMVAASLLILGRLASVDRPAIGTLIPTLDSQFLLLDAGANVQCSPEHLLRFAQMGDLYSREMLGLAKPRIGLLNIGQEEAKGSDLTLGAHRLLRQSCLHFIGNIESNRLLEGAADVVVTDGFTGNVILKLIEGFARHLENMIAAWGAGLTDKSALAPLSRFMGDRFNYEAYGGALLLGINGIGIISHGRSSARAITNAVLAARQQAILNIPEKLRAYLAA